MTKSISRPTQLRPGGQHLAGTCLAALGVVYGDIGTSPLYALRECFSGEHGVPVTHDNVLGVLSLIFWALTIVISMKYLAYVMYADNRGEGGILALMALALRSKVLSSNATGRKRRATIIALGLFGGALLYGDGMITPAISVLSAVEGLEIAAPSLHAWVQPITIGILVALFYFQRHGTARVGLVFGPLTLVWMLSLAGLGVAQLVERPEVLAALDPRYAGAFLRDNGRFGFFVLGAVFLAVTGGEALYADMGHFGRRPIQLTWFALVLPCLLLNYLGQGALLLQDPSNASHPFFALAPGWFLYPLIALSTTATIIASQAVISGAFSLTRQATMLGYWPRVQIQHTSAHEIGQIYVPGINWLLMVATIALVLGFGSSSELAAAYGIAVTTTMLVTTVLAHVVARYQWGWSRLQAAALTAALLIVDLAFFGANLVKFGHGGWVPVAIASVVFLLMTTWHEGRRTLATRVAESTVPLEDFFEVMRIDRPARVPGTAVFMTSTAAGTPTALMHNFQHNRVVHQQVILLTIKTEEVSFVDEEQRVEVEPLEHGFTRVVARYGFLETPNAAELLARDDTPTPPIEYTTFFLGRETLNIESEGGMARWRKRLFALMARNAQRATSFFSIPSDRVVELGGQVEL